MGKKGGGRLENADLKVWTFHTLPCDIALKNQSDDYIGGCE